MFPRQADAADFPILLAAARAGDRNSLGILLERRRPLLNYLARRWLAAALRSKVDDAELVQEALVTALRHFDNFQGATRPEFVGWVSGILRNVSRNFHRDLCGRARRQATREVSLDSNRAVAAAARAIPSPGSSPSEAALERESLALLSRAMEPCRPRTRCCCARGSGMPSAGRTSATYSVSRLTRPGTASPASFTGSSNGSPRSLPLVRHPRLPTSAARK